MITSINKLRTELEGLILANGNINQFYWKDLTRAMSENSDINYPLVCAYKSTGTLLTNQDRIQLTIDVADKLYQDFTNLNDIESDTLNWCRQIFNGMNSVRWKKLGRIESCSVRYFLADNQDYVAGHTMTIDFLIRDKNGVCDLPFFDYDFDQVISGESTQVDVFNSDMSYSQVVECGGTLELPDISYEVTNTIGGVLASATVPSVNNISTVLSDVNNIDSDGSTVPTPAGVPFTCTPVAPCDDATANLKDTLGTLLSTTPIASGASADIVAPDANYTVEYLNGTPIDSGTIVSGGAKLIQIANPIVCADATVTLNSILMSTIPSGGTDNIQVLQSDDMTEVGSKQGVHWRIDDSAITLNTAPFLSVKAEDSQDIQLVDQNDIDITPISVVGSTIKVDVPVCGTPIGAELIKGGQETSYYTGDDGDVNAGRETSWYVLNGNNPFGNTNRFTDELGGTTYTNRIMIDWSTYSGSTVLGYKMDALASDTFENQVIAITALNIGGFTGWRMWNATEALNAMNKDHSILFNYNPLYLSGFGGYCFTSNTRSTVYGLKIFAQSLNVYLDTVALGTSPAMAVRTFTVTGTTLS